MKTLINLALGTMDETTPPVVRQAFERMADKFGKPPEPIMTAEEFEGLDRFKKIILTCNMPGCDQMVCTHHMLCVKHNQEFYERYNSNLVHTTDQGPSPDQQATG